MSDSAYDALILAISKKIAKPLVFDKLISDRRGTVVIKLFYRSSDALNPNYYALKFSELGSYEAQVIDNETTVLQDLGDFTHNLYCDGGESNNQRYVLTHWLDGQKVNDIAKTIKSIPTMAERQVAWLELSLKLTKKVHDLHNLGYLHYDIQPEHFRFIDNRLQLFDFGLSCQINKTNVLYKGALIHFQTPEVCNYLLQDNKTIHYDIKSEIYSVAATLFFLYTQQTAMEYDFKLPLKEKWQIIATAKPRSFADVEAEAFPVFEAVLQSCLEPNPDIRVNDLSQVIAKLEVTREEILLN